jgi:hypothetical protein
MPLDDLAGVANGGQVVDAIPALEQCEKRGKRGFALCGQLEPG